MKTKQIFINHIDELNSKINELNSIRPNLFLCFGSLEFFDSNLIIKKLKKHNPKSIIAGCSTAGEISNKDSSEGTLVITGFNFESSKITQATRKITLDKKEFELGQSIGEELITKDSNLTGIILLTLGHNLNNSLILDGLKSKIPNHIKIVGGLAGDNGQFDKTYVIDSENISSDQITAIGFGGPNLVFIDNSHAGWEPITEAYEITEYKNNILLKIDNLPALDFYKEKIGILSNHLPKSGLLFPFFIFNEKEKITRTVLQVSEADKSIILAGDIPKGSKLQLVRSSHNIILKDINENIYFLKKKFLNSKISSVGAIILFSCIGRKMILGSKFNEELKYVKDEFENETITGFYSYGEIGNNLQIESSSIHNQTLTMLYIGENHE